METEFVQLDQLDQLDSATDQDYIDEYDETSRKLCSSYKDGGGNGGNYVYISSDRSIVSELTAYGHIDEEIKNQADVIYNLMHKSTRRGKVRRQLLFYCVYCAYRELRRDVNPISLGQQFNLKPGDVQRCDSLFSQIKTGYKPRINTYASPLDYIPGYFDELGKLGCVEISSYITESALQLGKSIIDKEQSLLQENPQTVAAGLFHYFNLTNGIEYPDATTPSKITSRSNMTINNMFKRIATIDNA